MVVQSAIWINFIIIIILSGNLLKHYKERHPEHKPPEFYLDRLSEEDGYSDMIGLELSSNSTDETSHSNSGLKVTGRIVDITSSTDGTSEASTLNLTRRFKIKIVIDMVFNSYMLMFLFIFLFYFH